MNLSKTSIKAIQIISIAIVLLFVVLSSFDCIIIYERSTGHSQTAILDPEDVREPTVYTRSCNNELLYVAIIGCTEIILIIAMCFKLSIVASILELLISIGTLCMGYIESLFAEISGGVGAPLYTVTFDITATGYCGACIAIINVAITILLQLKKKTFAKVEGE